MAREPLAGMPARAGDSGGGSTQSSWDTEEEWGTNAASGYLCNNNGTIALGFAEDGFGSYSTGNAPGSPWSTYTGAFTTYEVQNDDFDYNGNSLHLDGSGLDNEYVFMENLNVSQDRPGQIGLSYYEESGSNGMFYALVDDGGDDDYLKIGTDNPQVVVFDDSGETTIKSNFSSDYQRWRRFDVDIDWINNTYELTWSDITGDESDVTHTGSLNSNASGGVSNIQLRAVDGSDKSVVGRFDNVSGWYDSGTWDTGVTDVGFSTTDVEVTVDYALNGHSIDLDIYSYDSEGATPDPPDTYSLDGTTTTFTASHDSDTQWWSLQFDLSTSDRTQTPEVYSASIADNA